MKQKHLNQRGFEPMTLLLLMIPMVMMMITMMAAAFVGIVVTPIMVAQLLNQNSSNINQGFCQEFGLNPGYNESVSKTMCVPTDGLNLKQLVAETIERNNRDLPFKEVLRDGIVQFMKDKITGGVEKFDENQVLYVGCTKSCQELDFFCLGGRISDGISGAAQGLINGFNSISFLPDIPTFPVNIPGFSPLWDARMNVPEGGNCPEQNKICEQVNDTTARCVDRPVVSNPPGKYYTCANAVCVEQDCPDNRTDCAELNAGGCSQANVGSACDQAPPPDCSVAVGCAGNAWELSCGTPNVPSNFDACQAIANACPEGQTCPVPECPGGNAGYACPNASQYCNSDTGTCGSVAEAACGTPISLHENARLPFWTDDAVDCGEVVNGKKGLRCPEGEACDLETGSCFNISSTLVQDNKKYSFNVTAGEDRAVGINPNPISNRDYRLPQLCIPDNGIFCGGCGLNTTDGSSSFLSGNALPLTFNRLDSKDATLRFGVLSRGVRGSNNYALINYGDVQKEDDRKRAVGEQFVVEITAPQLGECMVESGEFIGQTGVEAKTWIEYTWDFDRIDSGFCDWNASDPTDVPRACDATQFWISLLQKLNEAKESMEENQVNARTLDFNALLMRDAFTTDFRNDFAAFYSQVASKPSWYESSDNPSLSVLVTDETHLSFLTQALVAPGQYRVTVQISNGSQWLNADGTVHVNILVGLEAIENPRELDLSNPLYYLPMDGAVGTIAREDETTPNRDGYGISFSTNSMLLDGTLSLPATSGGLAQLPVTTVSSLDEVNQLNRRGRVLEIRLNADGSAQWVSSPTVATPVAAKISNRSLEEDSHQAKYVLLTASGSGFDRSNRPSFAMWTGIASKKSFEQDPICSDFQQKPLPVLMSDQFETGDPEGTRTLSFARGNTEQEKFVVLGTVFYVPRNQRLVLSRAADSNSILVTPQRKITDATTRADLAYTDAIPARPGFLPNGVKTNSLKEIIQLTSLPGNKAGPLCLFTERTNNGSLRAVFYWNRTALLDEVIDKEDTPFSPVGTTTADVLSGLGVSDSRWLCK